MTECKSKSECEICNEWSIKPYQNKLREAYQAILNTVPSHENEDVVCPLCKMHTSYAQAYSHNKELKIERDIEHYRSCIVNIAEKHFK
jgi:hypothetical protein